jgi:hypothetical protein
MSIVTSNVFAPILAEAVAASHPAWPPPITITSYFKIMWQSYEKTREIQKESLLFFLFPSAK